jgi:hypothetical protein
MANPISQTRHQDSSQMSNNTTNYFKSLESIFDKIVKGELPLRGRKYAFSNISNRKILINIANRIRNVASQIENFQKIRNDLRNSDNIPFEQTQIVNLGERILELPNGVKHAELVPIDKCYSLIDDFTQKELLIIQEKLKNEGLTKDKLSSFLEKTGNSSKLRLLAFKINKFADQRIRINDKEIYFVNRISDFKNIIEDLVEFVKKQSHFMNDFNAGSLKRYELDIIIQDGTELYQIIQDGSELFEKLEIAKDDPSGNLAEVFKESFNDISALIKQFEHLKKEFDDIANYPAINELNENEVILGKLVKEFYKKKLEAERA